MKIRQACGTHTHSPTLRHTQIGRIQQVSCWQHVASNMQLKRRR